MGDTIVQASFEAAHRLRGRYFLHVHQHAHWLATLLVLIVLGSIGGNLPRPHTVSAETLNGLTLLWPSLTPTNDNLRTEAWIYPEAPGAMRTLEEGRTLFAIKAEFLHVEEDGSLTQINQSDATPNGYSERNVSIMETHSAEQYITVSGDMAGTALAMQRPQQTIDTMVHLANQAGFGIELDWEDFGQWTPEYYQAYKTFVRQLATTLHANGHRFMIDGPPIYDDASQSWYQWRYEELAPLVDNIVMMIYDNQYDTGVGNAIAPHDWSMQCMRWLYDKVGNKATAGIASYGYTGTFDSGRIRVASTDSVVRLLRGLLGPLTATRNDGGELTITSGDTFYDYSDQQTMDFRREEVEHSGLTRLSVWSLGDNPWF